MTGFINFFKKYFSIIRSWCFILCLWCCLTGYRYQYFYRKDSVSIGRSLSWKMFLQVANRFVFLAMLLMATLCVHAKNKEANEYALKASYLTLFTHYTSWPVGSLSESNTPIYICVLGSNPFGQLLEQSAVGRKGGALLEVKYIKSHKEADQCQVIFISKRERNNEAKWIAALKDKPILTVGESVQAIKHGCAVAFNTEESRIKFEVNLVVVANANLKINSSMLNYASKVYRDTNVSP